MMKKLLLILLLNSLFIIKAEANETNKITGILQVPFQSNSKYICSEQSRVTNLGNNSSFLIKNENNHIIYKGGFDGKQSELQKIICNLHLITSNVPKSKFYTFDFGQNRTYTYSHNELIERNWDINLYLNTDGIILKPYNK